MDTPISQTPEVDLHCLERRFAQARLLEPRAIESLARSIEQSGQLIACIAVPDADSNRLILVDGYRRALALRRLDAIQPAQVVSLKKIYASLRDSMSAPIDWFEVESADDASAAHTPAPASRTDSVKDKLRAKKETKVVDPQDQALLDLEKKPAPIATFAQVAEQLNKAGNPDLLDTAADLIREIADEAQRKELFTNLGERYLGIWTKTLGLLLPGESIRDAPSLAA